MLLHDNNRNDQAWPIWLILLFFLVNQNVVIGLSQANNPTPHSLCTTDHPVATIKLICAEISKGNFLSAQSLLNETYERDNSSISCLSEILHKYKLIKRNYEIAKKNVYLKQVDELNKLRNNVWLEDIDAVGRIFSIIIKTFEYADEKQKYNLLKDAFVKQVITKTERRCSELEALGNWVDAYTCFTWLQSINESNSEYNNNIERLAEKIALETALRDDICKTSAERHMGIKPEMFRKAIEILDFRHISLMNYDEMAIKSLDRCSLLGDVFVGSRKKLAYSIKKYKLNEWSTGLAEIRNKLTSSGSSITIDKFIWIFDEILALNTSTVHIPQEVIVAQFSEAALVTIDPFTNIIWPTQTKDFQKDIRQQFSGIGVQISKTPEGLKVTSLLPDTPAYLSKLDVEDLIVSIDGDSTRDMNLSCAIGKITGIEGTKVTLAVKKAKSSKIDNIIIMRANIVVSTIQGWRRIGKDTWQHILDPWNRIGYIRITNFTKTTVPELNKLLNKLDDEGLNGLILDLRFNTGGYYNAAVAVADMFIESGPIVTRQPRWGASVCEVAHANETQPNYPLVILINGKSASASEIVAGALQDSKHERAIIVGSRSYGKGSIVVMTPFPGDGSQLWYTTAYYLLPSGEQLKNRHSLEKEGKTNWGITPDVKIELCSDELKNILDMQHTNGVLAKNHKPGSNQTKMYSLGDIIRNDLQLSIGMLVLKSKMIESGCKLLPGH